MRASEIFLPLFRLCNIMMDNIIVLKAVLLLPGTIFHLGAIRWDYVGSIAWDYAGSLSNLPRHLQQLIAPLLCQDIHIIEYTVLMVILIKNHML